MYVDYLFMPKYAHTWLCVPQYIFFSSVPWIGALVESQLQVDTTQTGEEEPFTNYVTQIYPFIHPRYVIY